MKNNPGKKIVIPFVIVFFFYLFIANSGPATFFFDKENYHVMSLIFILIITAGMLPYYLFELKHFGSTKSKQSLTIFIFVTLLLLHTFIALTPAIFSDTKIIQGDCTIKASYSTGYVSFKVKVDNQSIAISDDTAFKISNDAIGYGNSVKNFECNQSKIRVEFIPGLKALVNWEFID